MSIRCDTSGLIGGAIVCGVPGLGIRGSIILATTGEGGSGPGILFNDVEAGDEDKEFRALVTDWPDTGVLVINENGTFTFTGPGTDTFLYQLYVDGVAVGVPASVGLYGSNLAAQITELLGVAEVSSISVMLSQSTAEGATASEATDGGVAGSLSVVEVGTVGEANTGALAAGVGASEIATASDASGSSSTALVGVTEAGEALDQFSTVAIVSYFAQMVEAGVASSLASASQEAQSTIAEAGAASEQLGSGGTVIASMVEALNVAELLSQLYSFSITQTEAMTPEDLVAALSVALGAQAFEVALVTESQLLSLTTNSEQGEVLVVAEIQTTDIPTTPTTVLEELTAYDLVARLQYLKGSGAFTVSSPERRFIIFSHPRD